MKYEYERCLVCNRELHSDSARTLGMGGTCASNTLLRGLPLYAREHAAEEYRIIRLREQKEKLQRRLKARKG